MALSTGVTVEPLPSLDACCRAARPAPPVAKGILLRTALCGGACVPVHSCCSDYSSHMCVESTSTLKLSSGWQDKVQPSEPCSQKKATVIHEYIFESHWGNKCCTRNAIASTSVHVNWKSCCWHASKPYHSSVMIYTL